jgi:hypothetical protein
MNGRQRDRGDRGDKETERQRDRETERQRDRETERQRETQRTDGKTKLFKETIKIFFS